jgi:hypothetical protein
VIFVVLFVYPVLHLHQLCSQNNSRSGDVVIIIVVVVIIVGIITTIADSIGMIVEVDVKVVEVWC